MIPIRKWKEVKKEEARGGDKASFSARKKTR